MPHTKSTEVKIWNRGWSKQLGGKKELQKKPGE